MVTLPENFYKQNLKTEEKVNGKFENNENYK